MGQSITTGGQAEMPPRHGTASGSQSSLLLSSKLHAWNGIVLELFRARDVDVIVKYCEPVVSLILRGTIKLFQSRGRHISQRMLHPGDIIITPVGESKVIRHCEEADVLKVHLAPALLERVFADVRDVRSGDIELLDNFGTRDVHLESLATRLLAELKVEGFASSIYVQSLANELAVHLLRHYSTAKKVTEPMVVSLPQYKLRRAMEYINDSLREDLTLERISDELAMSPYRFARGFKQAAGLTPHRYVIQCRMERAKSLLRETELSITEIAYDIGYANQSHFSVVFHRFTGQTPRSYRSAS
jgi:AraC family transcriptional regulator